MNDAAVLMQKSIGRLTKDNDKLQLKVTKLIDQFNNTKQSLDSKRRDLELRKSQQGPSNTKLHANTVHVTQLLLP
jgi:hypothetical protein